MSKRFISPLHAQNLVFPSNPAIFNQNQYKYMLIQERDVQNLLMNECLRTSQHENTSAIGCQTKMFI